MDGNVNLSTEAFHLQLDLRTGADRDYLISLTERDLRLKSWDFDYGACEHIIVVSFLSESGDTEFLRRSERQRVNSLGVEVEYNSHGLVSENMVAGDG